MSATPDWDLLQSLQAVLETGSFSAAARRRGLTQPTLGRHVDALEARFGAPLFVRSSRGLQPTDLALSLQPHLKDMFAAAAAAARDALGSTQDVSGPIRITASQVVGAEVLPPILAAFREQHPQVVIELVLSNETQNLLRREADIAVRMVAPAQEALVAKKVGVLNLGFYATADYLARHGEPKSLEALRSHALIGFDTVAPNTRDLPDFGFPVDRDLFAFRSDSDLAQLAALRAGFGVGLCQHALAARYGLQPLLPDFTGLSFGMWIVMHEALKSNRRMRLMFDHLVEGLGAYVRAAP